jgi:hypothetical protein
MAAKKKEEEAPPEEPAEEPPANVDNAPHGRRVQGIN